jgi:hypothetical protein
MECPDEAAALRMVAADCANSNRRQCASVQKSALAFIRPSFALMHFYLAFI